jgi:3-oxoacyl-[acyl-carrier-protein] synthase III
MISGISVQLPTGRLTNAELACLFPDWPAEQVLAKTGIASRPITAPSEYSSDLATGAARVLAGSGGVRATDFLVLCTQTPDFLLPSTACLVHERLSLPEEVGAVDVNMGCSGYIYALSYATGLIASGQASRPLVLTADTYSKLLAPGDRSTRTLFGDAGTATLLEATSRNRLHAFAFGTRGRGRCLFEAANSGMHGPLAGDADARPADARAQIAMDGPEIYNFSLKAVPQLVATVCNKAGLTLGEVDWFVFHQANAFMLESLRRKMRIPAERFEVNMAEYGNTVSSTIPIALRGAIAAGRIQPGMRIMLVGFGVGLSWGGCMFDYTDPIETHEKNGFSSSA